MIHNKIIALIFFLCTSIGLYAQVSGTYCLAALYEGRYYVAENTLEGSNSYFKVLKTGEINGVIVIDNEKEKYCWSIEYNTENQTATIKNTDDKYLSINSNSEDKKTPASLITKPFVFKIIDGEFHTNTKEDYPRAFAYNKAYPRMASYTVSNSYPPAKAYPITEGYFREIAVSQDGYKYGTICLPSDVAADKVKGATFYEIVGKQMNGSVVQSIVLEEVSGGLTAGKAYVFKATSDIVAAYSGNKTTEPVNANGFCGVLDGTKSISEAESGMYYGIASNMVQKLTTGASIPANRAYIDMSSVPEYNEQTSNQTKHRMVFKVQNGATSIKAETVGTTSTTYNINGVKTPTPMQGLHIINGKKILKR